MMQRAAGTEASDTLMNHLPKNRWYSSLHLSLFTYINHQQKLPQKWQLFYTRH
ncbi:MAG: hypothetical protein JWR61_4840 [Ferruginibacter sp.]|nr:hypothetical protein [Ferruginibacter sp.]